MTFRNLWIIGLLLPLSLLGERFTAQRASTYDYEVVGTIPATVITKEGKEISGELRYEHGVANAKERLWYVLGGSAGYGTIGVGMGCCLPLLGNVILGTGGMIIGGFAGSKIPIEPRYRVYFAADNAGEVKLRDLDTYFRPDNRFLFDRETGQSAIVKNAANVQHEVRIRGLKIHLSGSEAEGAIDKVEAETLLPKSVRSDSKKVTVVQPIFELSEPSSPSSWYETRYNRVVFHDGRYRTIVPLAQSEGELHFVFEYQLEAAKEGKVPIRVYRANMPEVGLVATSDLKKIQWSERDNPPKKEPAFEKVFDMKTSPQNDVTDPTYLEHRYKELAQAEPSQSTPPDRSECITSAYDGFRTRSGK